MKMAAMGVRMHSGWGALVVVANEDGRVNVVARERIEVIDEKAGGKRQPYHRARNLALNEAEKYLARCAAESKRLATESIRGLMEDLQKRGYRLANCAVLTASGRELPPLVRILAAHPLIHTAEGEFFRNAICSACEGLRLSALRVREREVESAANTSLGRSVAAVMKQIANAGKSLGSPWTQDHKKAALAAWMALHEHNGGTMIPKALAKVRTVIRRNEVLEFMRSHPLVTAATISPDGAPQAAILGVAASDQLELVFDTVDNSRKFRNVQRDGRVAVVFGAAGGYKSGSHDERTVQYEGRADIPSGEELKRVQEEIYFKQFPDGRARLKWEHITYVHVRPTWIRYSNYNEGPPEIVEWSGDALAKLVRWPS